jgi:hypothetical protein
MCGLEWIYTKIVGIIIIIIILKLKTSAQRLLFRALWALSPGAVFGKASGLRADRCPGRIAPPYLPSSD